MYLMGAIIRYRLESPLVTLLSAGRLTWLFTSLAYHTAGRHELDLGAQYSLPVAYHVVAKSALLTVLNFQIHLIFHSNDLQYIALIT